MSDLKAEREWLENKPGKQAGISKTRYLAFIKCAETLRLMGCTGNCKDVIAKHPNASPCIRCAALAQLEAAP